MTPKMAPEPSSMMSQPLSCASALSPTHVGSVAVMEPTPSPVTIRAMMSCASWKLVAWRTTPTRTTMQAPVAVFFLPKRLPMTKQVRAPTAAPTSYSATAVPSRVEFRAFSSGVVVSIAGKVATKEGSVRRPFMSA
ncbi:hypothetical protein Tdes44962_MAKER09053 [Teratosphaeria destructans]|uniref:Uncharacterized protein n=1 Tax=Teratosphaeria destructans TaxID=418781 RepID=A0A9W7SUH6_9PEZI|nr:hypothetical protein Tdes44962_MAKER09053 [Teratosphaeria destructans]